MAAMNGSAVSFRGHGRLIGCCTALALMLAAFVIAPAGASAQAPATTTYLALGDSISYGYSEERFNLHFPTESPSYFDEGFTNGFAKDLGKGSEVGKSIRLVNDACPGETSQGLIGENTELGGKTSTESYAEVEGPGGYQGQGDYHPCKWVFRGSDGSGPLPLHNGGYFDAGKEVSQLEEAVSSIESKTSPVKAITINIGSNDELAGITKCEDEHYTEGEGAIIACISAESKNVIVPAILKNLGDIIVQLDLKGYTGPIVLLGFYNPDTFILPSSDELQSATNTAVEDVLLPELKTDYGITNVTYANPFPVFNKDSGTNAAKEKEAICKYTEMCNTNDPGGSEGKGDIHPSPAGYKELAKLVNKAYLENPAK